MTSRLAAMGGRALSRVFLVAIFVLVAAGVSQGGTGPRTPYRRSTTTAPASTDRPRHASGRQRSQKQGNILTVKVTLHGADPGGSILFLATASNPCQVLRLHKFKVDASGDGSVKGSIDVTGLGNSFVVDAYNRATDLDNYSDTVTL